MSHAAQRLQRLREQVLRSSQRALGHTLIVASSTDKTAPFTAVVHMILIDVQDAVDG
jgi:hypothetical protein